MSESDVLAKCRRVIRQRDMSPKTEESYLASIRKYLSYFQSRDSKPPKEEAIAEFLTHEAVQRNVAVNTQRSLLNGIMFMYRDVFRVEVGQIADYVKSIRPKKLPVVYTQRECLAALNELDGTYKIMVGLLYGAGLRRACGRPSSSTSGWSGQIWATTRRRNRAGPRMPCR